MTVHDPAIPGDYAADIVALRQRAERAEAQLARGGQHHLRCDACGQVTSGIFSVETPGDACVYFCLECITNGHAEHYVEVQRERVILAERLIRQVRLRADLTAVSIKRTRH